MPKEIVESIDQDMSDGGRFGAMKTVFLHIVTQGFSNQVSLMRYEFMMIKAQLRM